MSASSMKNAAAELFNRTNAAAPSNDTPAIDQTVDTPATATAPTTPKESKPKAPRAPKPKQESKPVDNAGSTGDTGSTPATADQPATLTPAMVAALTSGDMSKLSLAEIAIMQRILTGAVQQVKRAESVAKQIDHVATVKGSALVKIETSNPLVKAFTKGTTVQQALDAITFLTNVVNGTIAEYNTTAKANVKLLDPVAIGSGRAIASSGTRAAPSTPSADGEERSWTTMIRYMEQDQKGVKNGPMIYLSPTKANAAMRIKDSEKGPLVYYKGEWTALRAAGKEFNGWTAFGSWAMAFVMYNGKLIKAGDYYDLRKAQESK